MPFLFESNPHQGEVGKLVDGKMGYITPIDAKKYHLVPGSGRPLHHGMDDGLPVKPDNVPTKIKLTRNRNTLYCLWQCWGMWTVCEEFRELVERLEPGVHQFFPVDVLDRRDHVVFKYYLLNICNRIDCIAQDRSEINISYRKSGEISQYSTKKLPKKLILMKGTFEKFHMWRDKYLGMDQLSCFCSDELAYEVKARKMKFIRLTYVGFV